MENTDMENSESRDPISDLPSSSSQSSSLDAQVNQLLQLVRQASHIVCYTGAGISTSCGVPDYRGTDGVWTRLNQGRSIDDINQIDLRMLQPSRTHMAIAELCRRNVIKHVVSQNCDGLHLRSGIPRANLSEIHGNSFIELCMTCPSQPEFIRDFDVTAKSAFRLPYSGGSVLTGDMKQNGNVNSAVVRCRTPLSTAARRAGRAPHSIGKEPSIAQAEVI
eukprot:m.263880 g.263880  ORF g.263880 m.263880 type:complete len:220 (-) comp54650_c0_seq8:417-1076(-)